MPILNKDMTLCISLSARPSNNGTRFHNYLYDALGLNYVYKAFAPTDLGQAIAGVRGLGIRGCAVSMPYKEDVIALVDEMDASALAIDSVNTVVNTDGVLRAYNTDYVAVERLLRENAVSASSRVLVQGAGGMAKAVVAALRNNGFDAVTVLARNVSRGRALAEKYGFEHVTSVPEGATYDVLINVTPLGMAGDAADVVAFDDSLIAGAAVVFDVVAMPALTPLIRRARELGKTVITGDQVAAIQAEEQFVLYTGVRPARELVAEAAAFSRAQ